MCPANGEMENHDRESPVEFLCHVAHLRAAALEIEIPEHGDCEFCAGGERHGEMMQSARRIANKEIDIEGWQEPVQLLPILSNPGSSALTGCGTLVIEVRPRRKSE